MSSALLPAVIAVVAGVLAGVLLFVPFVARSYRSRGGLSLGRTLLWAAALVYFWAIWAYTLLPLPEPDSVRCAGVNLDLGQLVRDLRTAAAASGNTLTRPETLQLALNVLLFVPLGALLRLLAGRGIVAAALLGFATSLAVELTQLTGVWGIYPCAYRVFDVVDLITNTSGALLGSVLALAVPARLRGGRVPEQALLPRPVTKGRRLLGAVCDLLGALIVSYAVGIGVQLVLTLLGRRDEVVSGQLGSDAAAWAPLVVWVLVFALSRRTVGDLCVDIRFAGGPLPRVLAAPLRFLGGVGGYLVLGVTPLGDTLVSTAFAALSLVLIAVTPQGRGLPGFVSGQVLRDARDVAAAEPVREPAG